MIAELADPDTARTIQLAIEYDPQPPFDAGSPSQGRAGGDAARARGARKVEVVSMYCQCSTATRAATREADAGYWSLGVTTRSD
jgi:hypothetical protein